MIKGVLPSSIDQEIGKYLKDSNLGSLNGLKLLSITEDYSRTRTLKARHLSKTIQSLALKLTENNINSHNPDISYIAEKVNEPTILENHSELKTIIFRINSFLKKEGKIFLFSIDEIKYNDLNSIFFESIGTLDWVPK